jgi:toxin ParE1/3/4
MIVAFTDEAKANLRAIGDWIANENPARAETFVDELVASCEQLADMPQAFPLLRQRPETGIRRRVH